MVVLLYQRFPDQSSLYLRGPGHIKTIGPPWFLYHNKPTRRFRKIEIIVLIIYIIEKKNH